MGDKEISDKLEKVLKTFESTNGNSIKDFSQKQIIVLLHGEIKDDLKTITKKIDKHVEKGDKEQETFMKHIHEHDLILKEITDAMPEKGWCGKVDAALFPQLPDMPLYYKVNTMWHDRRWTKAIVLMLLGTGGVSLINLILFIMGR